MYNLIYRRICGGSNLTGRFGRPEFLLELSRIATRLFRSWTSFLSLYNAFFKRTISPSWWRSLASIFETLSFRSRWLSSMFLDASITAINNNKSMKIKRHVSKRWCTLIFIRISGTWICQIVPTVTAHNYGELFVFKAFQFLIFCHVNATLPVHLK